MRYTISKAEVWVADIPNQPGTLAGVLEPLAKAGAQLEFLIARKVDDNTSRVFLAPIKGVKGKQAAKNIGLNPTSNMFAIRIEGPDRPGLGAAIARALANDGINLRGASAAAIGRTAVFYIALETEQAMKDATRTIRKLLARKTQ